MKKVNKKKTEILNTALGLVRKLGFESVSIANLAYEVGMSKSGLFAHFNSKEKMHLMILDHAAVDFTQSVIVPAISKERGLPRLQAIIDNWISWYGFAHEGTCPFVAAGVEYDLRPGPVKDRLQYHLKSLVKAITKAIDICVEEGQLKSDLDTKLLAYQMYSLVIGAQIFHKTLNDKDAKKNLLIVINDLINRYAK